jgi:crossover junction endodeoxyribonuclease RuvC
LTKILGIDPGLTRCGVGVISLSKSRKVQLLEVVVLVSPKDSELVARIGSIGNELEGLILRHQPDIIAIERVFSQQNLSSVMGTAQISGVAIFLADKYSIPIAMHTPTEVKASVTGSGRASKAQVGKMVAQLLGLQDVPKPADAADALAIAICQGFRGGNSTASYTKAQLKWHEASKSAATKVKR